MSLLPSANPFDVIRSFPVKLIPLDKIDSTKEGPEDKIFMSRYIAFLNGKAAIHLTRLSLEKIRRGFWRPDNGAFSLMSDSPPDEAINSMKDFISLGGRPALYVYENPNKMDEAKYVCCDDEAAHIAYESLGIKVVPVAIMGVPKHAEESCISIKSYQKNNKNSITLLDGYVYTSHEKTASLLHKKNLSRKEALEYLIHCLSQLKERLRQFHRPGFTEFHYHHTLYSILLRAEETIESINLLLETKRVLVAASLLRPLYELMLTFYIDWLAPEFTCRYLQLSSVLSEKKWKENCEKERNKLRTNGTSHANAQKIYEAQLRAYRLCSVVSEKAKLFPLGEEFHKNIYSFLSDIVHHDFSMNARYAHTLEHGDEAIYNEDVEKSLMHLIDIVVSAIFSRIQTDVGLQPIKIEHQTDVIDAPTQISNA